MRWLECPRGKDRPRCLTARAGQTKFAFIRCSTSSCIMFGNQSENALAIVLGRCCRLPGHSCVVSATTNFCAWCSWARDHPQWRWWTSLVTVTRWRPLLSGRPGLAWFATTCCSGRYFHCKCPCSSHVYTVNIYIWTVKFRTGDEICMENVEDIHVFVS